jgi:peptidyl-prolyl cis-trans isomerase C
MSAPIHTLFQARLPAVAPAKCNHETPAVAAVPVSVNGVDIPQAAIAREMQNHPAAEPDAAWQSAARALVVRELLLQRARQAAIRPRALTDAAGRRETHEEALVRTLIETEVTVPEPDEDTCRRYYRQNRHRFRSQPIYEAAHILFAAPADNPEAYSRARCDAELARAELQRRPQRFDELARRHSACPSAAQGGNLGQITTGQVTPEFEQALVRLKPGDMTEEPVATRYGLHIIRLDRKIEGRQLPFEVVGEWVANYLRDSVIRRATAQYIARLVTAAAITGVEIAGAAENRVS